MLQIQREKYPYRKATLGIVIDSEQKFLIVSKQSYKDNEWSFAGGGIEENESPKESVLRELQEELGSDKFSIISESPTFYNYEWPDREIIMSFNKRGKYYRGQQVQYFLVKFQGEPSEINFQQKEIKKIKWVSLNELPEHLIFPGQWKSTKKVLLEFNFQF